VPISLKPVLFNTRDLNLRFSFSRLLQLAMGLDNIYRVNLLDTETLKIFAAFNFNVPLQNVFMSESRLYARFDVDMYYLRIFASWISLRGPVAHFVAPRLVAV
jgi:hypothetical protein